MRPSFLWLSAFLLACDGTGGGDDTGGDDTSDTDTADTDTGGGDTDTDVNNNWNGSDNGVETPTRAPDQVISGNLADGAVLPSLSWMESGDFACGTVFDQSCTGAHDYHTYAQSELSDLYVRLVPDQGLDMSLYLLQRSDGSTALPPAVAAQPAGGGDCDSSYDNDGNPSQPEAMCVYSTQGRQFSVLIGVAGAEGLTSGSYQLEIWENHPSSVGCVHPND